VKAKPRTSKTKVYTRLTDRQLSKQDTDVVTNDDNADATDDKTYNHKSPYQQW